MLLDSHAGGRQVAESGVGTHPGEGHQDLGDKRAYQSPDHVFQMETSPVGLDIGELQLSEENRH